MKYVVGHGEHPEDAEDEEHLGVQNLVREVLVKDTVNVQSENYNLSKIQLKWHVKI